MRAPCTILAFQFSSVNHEHRTVLPGRVNSFVLSLLFKGSPLEATSDAGVPRATPSGGVHYGRLISGVRRYVSGATASRRVDGDCLCVFSDEVGLVLGLCCVLRGAAESITKWEANVSGTTTSDRIDFGLAASCLRGIDTARERRALDIT